MHEQEDLFVYGLLKDAVSSECTAMNVKMISYELGRLRKKAAVACFEVLSRYFAGGTEGHR
jgi:hypothetical protein